MDKKAIVIVDMLNDFVNEDGALAVPGAKEIVENIGKIKGTAGEYGVMVVYANDAHDPDDIEFKLWPKHAVKDTYSAMVINELAPGKKDNVFEKQDIPMFTNPDLNTLLQKNEIDELYITGVATEYCVRGAVLNGEDKFGDAVKGAIDIGYKVNVVVDAIAGVDVQKGDQYKALIEMGNAGAKPKYTAQVLEELVTC